MTLTSLQVLTWGTVAGAVLSALLLAAGESGLPELSRLKRVGTATRPTPSEPSAAGVQRPVNATGKQDVAISNRRDPGGR